MNSPTVQDVRDFWENNPLFTGESSFEPGSREFFEEHRRVIIEDCSAGSLDPRTMPDSRHNRSVLDLGCGPGFWLIELSKNGAQELTGADLTDNALALSRLRCDIYGVKARLLRENAEKLTFGDGVFSHVNCQGVIHHTPNTEKCIEEIARVLEKSGTASISVYYKNIFIEQWWWLRFVGLALYKMGAALKGRGREEIFSLRSAEEIVRYYDGSRNPIGKAYSRKEFISMLKKHFEVQETYLHFFPARSLPFRMPRWMHRFLDRNFGFMIYATCLKK